MQDACGPIRSLRISCGRPTPAHPPHTTSVDFALTVHEARLLRHYPRATTPKQHLGAYLFRPGGSSFATRFTSTPDCVEGLECSDSRTYVSFVDRDVGCASSYCVRSTMISLVPQSGRCMLYGAGRLRQRDRARRRRPRPAPKPSACARAPRRTRTGPPGRPPAHSGHVMRCADGLRRPGRGRNSVRVVAPLRGLPIQTQTSDPSAGHATREGGPSPCCGRPTMPDYHARDTQALTAQRPGALPSISSSIAAASVSSTS